MKFRPASLLPRGNVRLTPPVGFARPRTIRARLTRILLVSVTLVLALLAIIIGGEFGRYRDTGATARAVSLALAVQDLVHEVQRERGLTNGLLGGDDSLRQTVANQRDATDTALHALNFALSGNPTGADQVRSAVAQLSGMSANRADVDARRIDRAATFQFYSGGIAALNRARPDLDRARDTDLWRGLQALYALGEAKEYTAQERGFLNGVFTSGGFGPGEYVRFLDIRAAKLAAITAFERDATAEQSILLTTAMRSEDSTRAAAAEAIAIGSTAGPLLEPVSAAEWWRQMTSVIDSEHGVQRAVGDEIRARADEMRDRATLVLGAYLLAALLAIAAQVTLVVAAVRAIVGPLARLAAEADEVATRRLPDLITAWRRNDGTDPEPPEPVRLGIRAGDEIISVAKAFDRVQTTAFDLASDQALLRRNTTESLANLARRNQNLVRRQLGLISEFEREELDPNALSNLFELDHLATRMRRNAESLLVLVGESSPRRWSEPIPLSDVVRAGLSEVDDYRRVILRRVDDIDIVGSAVSELAHMLAELIENGLSFSPPDLEVEIYGRRLGPRYLIAVVDHGVGMSPDQLAIANARLRGEADFLVAPTRYLGHYVVGRLARRLGVEVELTVSPVSGIVARLLLPETLVGAPNSPALESKHGAAQPLALTQGAPVGPNTGRHRQVWPGGAPPTAAADTDPAVVGIASITEIDPAAKAFTGASLDPTSSANLTAVNGFPTAQSGVGSIETDGTHSSATNGAATGTVTTHPLNGTSIPLAEKLFQVNHAPATTPANEVAAVGTSAVTLAPNESHSDDTATDAGVQRTRNGLVKRSRKTREHAGTTPEKSRFAPTRQPPALVAGRSPEEVRGMLAGFRAGHQRGERGDQPHPQEDRR